MYLYIKQTIELILGINKKIDLTLTRDPIDARNLYIDKTVNFILYRER